jgi:tRNA dimethylallyltransferase
VISPGPVTPPAVLLLAGPTAVGKTEIALQLASLLNAEIVSADARQLYKYLDIGSAKPTRAQQEAVPHHLIDICEPEEAYSAARFAADATAAIADIHRRGRQAIVAGGTGLYLKALQEGLFEAPEVTPETRDQVDSMVQSAGNRELVSYLKQHDPQTLAGLDRQNEARLRRAVEFHLQTHESLVESQQSGLTLGADFRFLSVFLARPRLQVYARVEDRVDQMLQAGWLEEVRNLLERFEFSLPAFNAVGYHELESVVRQDVTLDDARTRIVQRTRRYVKRQLTWFTHQGQWIWMSVENGVTVKIASAFGDFTENKSA